MLEKERVREREFKVGDWNERAFTKLSKIN